MTTATIELPIPPSVNAAFFNRRKGQRGRGRVRSKAYDAWINDAGWTVTIAKLPKFKGAYTFALALPDKMAGDVDGRIKAAVDVFVKLGVTPDDKYCSAVSARRSADVPPGRCVVQIEGSL